MEKFQSQMCVWVFACTITSKALNFYRYKTFVVFESVTLDFFLKIMESVGDDANSVFHEDQIFFKSVTFEILNFQKMLRKCWV